MGRWIDWWYFRNPTVNRVARFGSAGLPDNALFRLLPFNWRQKLENRYMSVFLDDKTIWDIFETIPLTGLPVFALQGCQINIFLFLVFYHENRPQIFYTPYLAQEIEWWYFRNSTTNRVARFCITGLPDIIFSIDFHKNCDIDMKIGISPYFRPRNRLGMFSKS